jgi:Outer membrane protein beta-barrel domain
MFKRNQRTRIGRWRICFLTCLMFASSAAFGAEAKYFVGGMGGFSTLSADHRAIITNTTSTITAYETMNGPAMMFYVGRHMTDYLSVQATYGWNRNDLILTSLESSASGQSSYEQMRSSSQQSVVGDLMLYFRDRKSFARPFLSVGTGWTHFTIAESGVASLVGAPSLPPAKLTSNALPLRVAVGIDLFVRKGWAFRYSFAETIRSNPISQQLSPPAQHDLANFQNFFGLTRQF